MMSSGAIVPRTTSIRVRESPCILASPSTTSMTTTPRLSGTALEMDKDDAAVSATLWTSSTRWLINCRHRPPPGFQHEDARLHDDKSEPDWS